MEVHTRPSVIPILSEPSSIITPSGKYECDSSPDDPLPNYFTCTLGQAAAIGTFDTNKVKTITDFIEYQAGRFPDHYAVGFPVPALRGGPWTYELLSE